MCPACQDTGYRYHHGFEAELPCEDCPKCRDCGELLAQHDEQACEPALEEVA